MHYHAEIYLKKNTDIDMHIADMMNPHKERFFEEEDKFVGWWDWYQVGGRWTGVHNPEYDPCEDPRNHEPCSVCGGTGYRTDVLGERNRFKEPSYTCNGCGEFDRESGKWRHGSLGKGLRVKWPSSFASASCDVMSLEDVRKTSPDLNCYTLMVGEDHYHKEIWDRNKWVKTDFDGGVLKKLEELGITDGYLVTVDYHC